MKHAVSISIGSSKRNMVVEVELLRQVGIKYLVTSTPVLDDCPFGTNMMEAALIASAGKGRKLTHAELSQMSDQIGFQLQLQELN